MKKPKSVKQLKKILDKVFSIYIRNRDKYCICCGSTTNLQAGHYFSRSYTNLRYDIVNVNAQCVACNVFKKGNIAVYTIRIIDKWGNTELKRLQENYRKEKRFTQKELLKLIQKYGTQRTN